MDFKKILIPKLVKKKYLSSNLKIGYYFIFSLYLLICIKLICPILCIIENMSKQKPFPLINLFKNLDKKISKVGQVLILTFSSTKIVIVDGLTFFMINFNWYIVFEQKISSCSNLGSILVNFPNIVHILHLCIMKSWRKDSLYNRISSDWIIFYNKFWVNLIRRRLFGLSSISNSIDLTSLK